MWQLKNRWRWNQILWDSMLPNFRLSSSSLLSIKSKQAQTLNLKSFLLCIQGLAIKKSTKKFHFSSIFPENHGLPIAIHDFKHQTKNQIAQTQGWSAKRSPCSLRGSRKGREKAICGAFVFLKPPCIPGPTWPCWGRVWLSSSNRWPHHPLRWKNIHSCHELSIKFFPFNFLWSTMKVQNQ